MLKPLPDRLAWPGEPCGGLDSGLPLPSSPDTQCGRHWIFIVTRTDEAKVQSSTKALFSHLNPNVPGRFSGIRFMCQVCPPVSCQSWGRGMLGWLGEGIQGGLEGLPGASRCVSPHTSTNSPADGKVRALGWNPCLSLPGWVTWSHLSPLPVTPSAQLALDLLTTGTQEGPLSWMRGWTDGHLD